MNYVATVVGISGTAQAVRADGSTIELMPGSQLLASDTVSTGAGSSVCMLFQDDAEISLGEETTIEIREFSFDASGETQPTFWVHMATGVVRSVSGKVVEQNPEAFKLSSPLGVAGIRGTTTVHEIRGDHEVHTVIELGHGHIVVITMNDGRSVVLTNSLELVQLKLDSLEPLLPQEVPRDLLREYLEQLTSMDRMRDGSHEELFALGGVDTLRWLGALPFIERLGYLPGRLDTPETLLGLPEEEIVWRLPEPPVVAVGVRLYGTSGNDRLFGTDYNDWIHGYSGDDTIYAGLGRDTVFGGYGSFDTIIKPGVMAEGSYIYGDDLILSSGAVGDNDIISVVAEAGKGPGDMTGGFIYGDAERIDTATGGNDVITVEGDMGGGVIYGDAAVINDGTGGNDSITVDGTMSAGAVIYGDAERLAYDGIGVGLGGDDEITVSAMAGGEIFGDALDIPGFSSAGDDTISIVTMNDGVIYGDGQNIGASGQAGDDVIHVDAMNGGIIYGDAQRMGASSKAGDDYIHVDAMNGGVIYGDAQSWGDDALGGENTIIIDTFTSGDVHMGLGNRPGIYQDSQTIYFDNSLAINSLEDGGEKKIYCADNQRDVITIADVVESTTISIFGKETEDIVKVENRVEVDASETYPNYTSHIYYLDDDVTLTIQYYTG